MFAKLLFFKLLSSVENKRVISQIFVAFLEYTNFKNNEEIEAETLKSPVVDKPCQTYMLGTLG